MANGVYNLAKTQIANGTIDLDTDTTKLMLVDTYTFNPDHDYIDNAGAGDPIDQEISVTGYTGGFGGAGRRTIALTVAQDNTNDRATIDGPDDTWTSLGAGATITGVILIKEVTNDTASPVICHMDLTPNITTNGGDVTVSFDAVGLMTFT